MIRITISVSDISFVLNSYDQIKVYYDTDSSGTFSTELTGPGTRINMIPEQTEYIFDDPDGTNVRYYKVSYYNSVTMEEGNKGSARQGGTESEKVGWSFGNYKPSPGEWGEVYTPDDMRYTMLWGIDTVAADIAQSEFDDEQFRQIVNEAVSEFEAYLTMDIRRKKYVTNPDSSLEQSRFWREGVDYTHEEDPYDFDPIQWKNYGFLQLRHWPLLEITRAQWLSPVKGEIMDMVENNWLRPYKQFGQVRMFPQGGFTYGPYSVYGPLWSHNNSAHYPGAFEFDYETGYKTAEFVPDGLRGTIGKYAAIKALAVVGDGLLAGFSSQSVSLDGLSESFSSTQSATSAYFGARIKQYSDEITAWLNKNRYKYSPVPMSFVGA
jgi:hypothetical protein